MCRPGAVRLPLVFVAACLGAALALSGSVQVRAQPGLQVFLDDEEVGAANVARADTAGERIRGSPEPTSVSVTNVRVGASASGARMVSFDLAWDESWRGPHRPSWVDAPDNWDAVWVFVKYRVDGGAWGHATLAGRGHSVPRGVVVSVPGDRIGAFVYRSSAGYGAFAANGVGLAWDVVADGVPTGASVEVQPFAIEMVYVPQGSFALGSGGFGAGEFRAGGTSNTPFVVSSPAPIALGNGLGQLTWTTSAGAGARGDSGSPSGSTSASFPTGFGACYVMKHEVTQGEYVAFLNTLTQAQADARTHTGDQHRFAITASGVGSYASSLPFVAMNFISWADGAAFADWAGLRPMTELEYEKVARGPGTPLADAYAWGSTSITQAIGLSNEGTFTERATPASANAAYGNVAGVQGPVRVGSFASPGRSRRDAGAGFYGVLELSGNAWERVVTVGHAEGRAFTGAHGDGMLDPDGDANVPSWPDATAVGAGFRGGGWYSNDGMLRVADRTHAANPNARRGTRHGWRGARSAP